MKKYLIYLVLVLIAGGIFFFVRKPDSPSTESKFFSPSEINTSDVVIKITGQGFEPSEIDIKAGQRVVWVNETPDFSWPASNPHPTHTGYSAFDPLEPLASGESWAFVFEEAGNWGMHDHLKPGKRGIIRVID